MTTPNFPRHYGEALPLYVAGHVSPEERAAIDRHLAECAECRCECETGFKKEIPVNSVLGVGGIPIGRAPRLEMQASNFQVLRPGLSFLLSQG